MMMMMMIAICLWDWNCGSCIVIKTVSTVTDLDCFEDIMAGSFEVHG